MEEELDIYEPEQGETNPALTQITGLISQIESSIEEEDDLYKDWVKQLQSRITDDNDSRSVIIEQLGKAIEMRGSKSAKLTKALDTIVKAMNTKTVNVNLSGGSPGEMSADERIALIKGL